MSDLQIIPVDPSRLAWGEWNHETGKEVGTGDIHSSYSADLIGSEGKVRRPFTHDGQLWVTVGLSGCSGKEHAEAYRIVPLQLFAGPTTTYKDKVEIENGDAARADPLGFYSAMLVACGRQQYVMKGPTCGVRCRRSAASRSKAPATTDGDVPAMKQSHSAKENPP